MMREAIYLLYISKGNLEIRRHMFERTALALVTKIRMATQWPPVNRSLSVSIDNLEDQTTAKGAVEKIWAQKLVIPTFQGVSDENLVKI